MASQDEFPKIEGDILFASEGNKFNPKPIAILNQVVELGSVGVFTNHGGSVLYQGTIGSTQISDFMVIEYYAAISSNSVVNVPRAARILISGPGVNNTVLNTKSFSTNAPSYINWNFKYLLTSGGLNDFGGNIGSNYIFQPQSLSAAGNNFAQDILVWGH